MCRLESEWRSLNLCIQGGITFDGDPLYIGRVACHKNDGVVYHIHGTMDPSKRGVTIDWYDPSNGAWSRKHFESGYEILVRTS